MMRVCRSYQSKYIIALERLELKLDPVKWRRSAYVKLYYYYIMNTTGIRYYIHMLCVHTKHELYNFC